MVICALDMVEIAKSLELLLQYVKNTNIVASYVVIAWLLQNMEGKLMINWPRDEIYIHAPYLAYYAEILHLSKPW